MNLVCIDNVTSALRFLIARPEPCEGHAFIVSDDDSPDNNYRDVERILRAAFGRPMTAMAPLPLPSGLLDASLWIRGHARSNLVYTGHRLAEAGWRRPVAFREGLQAFADWFASSRGSS